VLQNQIDTFLLELMGKCFSSHSHLVSVAHYIFNKVSGLIRPLHRPGLSSDKVMSFGKNAVISSRNRDTFHMPLLW
ncbi:hypothetical protein, partial [Biostraticola tofi]|uniref:hypothetical protein n=1 Tax=Biostraticola tofi TaxID=466109 RepID=UPI001E4C7509